MITYIDTSTLLKLIIDENGSERAMTIWSSTDAVASVNLIVVEARAALAAAKRDRRLTETQHRSAVAELEALVEDLHIVPVTEELVASAAELADDEGLRGYDAVHLAAALDCRSDRAQQRRHCALRRRCTPWAAHRQPAWKLKPAHTDRRSLGGIPGHSAWAEAAHFRRRVVRVCAAPIWSVCSIGQLDATVPV